MKHLCGHAGPQDADASKENLLSLLREHELSVRSIAFDSPHGTDQKRIAYVRLLPPTPFWRSHGADQEVMRAAHGLLWEVEVLTAV